jgi:hypothetical protein
MQEPPGSEVTQILAQIRAEYEAGQQALFGLASVSQHRMINHRMECLGLLHQELRRFVGDDAMKLMAETLESLS